MQVHSHNLGARRRRRALGLVQLAILTVIDRSPENAYGAGISDCVGKMTGQDFADAQIYVALHRLEDHAFVASWTGDVSGSSNGQRGRPRKFYRLTANGRKALRDAGVYLPSNLPFVQSTTRGDHEGKEKKSRIPTAVVV